jgi:hypothetical protein
MFKPWVSVHHSSALCWLYPGRLPDPIERQKARGSAKPRGECPGCRVRVDQHAGVGAGSDPGAVRSDVSATSTCGTGRPPSHGDCPAESGAQLGQYELRA